MARSLVRKPYKAFFGEEHTVRGVRGRGLFRVAILNVPPEVIKRGFNDDFRYLFCQVIEEIKQDPSTTFGQIYRIRIRHSTKEVLSRIYPLNED